MKTVPIFAILFILTTSCACSINLGISPEMLEFSDNTGSKVCNNFSLFGDNQTFLEGSLKWSKLESKNVADYNLTSEELKIDSSFPQLANSGKYQLCLASKNSGTYYGALLYKIQGSSYGIGTWINFEVKGNSFLEQASLISGRSIQEINPIKTGFITLSIILATILVFLIIQLKRKKL